LVIKSPFATIQGIGILVMIRPPFFSSSIVEVIHLPYVGKPQSGGVFRVSGDYLAASTAQQPNLVFQTTPSSI
jgi:hypothetical protein